MKCRVLEGCARAIHDTYDLMTFKGDPSTVAQIISYQSARMRTVRPLVFVNKMTYHHLHALWRQNNIDIYKLKITCEKWTCNLAVCRSMQREMTTRPAPGMVRMFGFTDDATIVAEVPVGDIPVIAQHVNLHMLN